MRQAGAVYYLHGDHLGSASLTTNASGAKYGELRYKNGLPRFSSPTVVAGP
jgi:hypothetical protein